MGFFGDIKSGFSDALQGVKDTISENKNFSADLTELAKQGTLAIGQSAVVGASSLLRDPKALVGAGAAVATGGASLGASGVGGLLSGFLGGQAATTDAGSIPASPPTSQGIPVWVLPAAIAGVAVIVILLIRK